METQWFLFNNDSDYKNGIARFEQVSLAKKNSKDHKEKILLAHLINKYEQTKWSLPDVDPVELIKIKMEEFGYKPVDLAKEYGDKGTVSKVLNYKQPLSLNMIRLFSKILHIPADVLFREYQLQ